MHKCDYTENHYCVQLPPCQNKTKQQQKHKQSKKNLEKYLQHIHKIWTSLIYKSF